MQINFASREMNFKIVYYGPGMAGKSTNLEILHQKTPEGFKGKLTSLSTEGDRTLFFDYLSAEHPKIYGMKALFQIFTVPGQVYYNTSRKLVLQGVDGIVFVADSQRGKLSENIESLKGLQENLRELGIKFSDVPLVMQWNKRDASEVVDLKLLEEQMNPGKAPSFEAVAHQGKGVLECASKIVEMILKKQEEKNPPSTHKSSEKAPEKKSEVSSSPQKTSSSPATASQEALAALLQGKALKNLELEILDFSNQTFEKEVMMEDVFCQKIIAHNSRFKGAVHWKNVRCHVLEMGGVYTMQNVEKPSRSKRMSAPIEMIQQEVLEKAPAHFEENLFLEEVTISQYADFDRVRFEGEALFHHLKFLSKEEVAGSLSQTARDEHFISFRRSEFCKDVEFHKCQMEGMDAREALFRGGVKILDSHFRGDVNFGVITSKNGAAFQEDLEIKDCEFSGKIRCKAVVFQKKFFALNTLFHQQAFFGEAKFQGPAQFFSSKFKGEAHFHLAIFEEEINFGEVAVEENTCWIKTRFGGRLYARQSKLGKVEMERVRCEKGADFQQSQFASIDLNYAIFEEESTFHEALFLGTCNFKGVRFEQKANFKGAQFQGSLIFTGMDADKMVVRWNQIEGKLKSEEEKNYSKAAEEYSLLKGLFERQQQYEDSDDAYYRYKQMERKALPLSLKNPFLLLKRFFNFCLLDLGCGYGTRPFRITFTSLVFIALFALCFSFFPGEFLYNGPENLKVEFGASNALYFSIATFTTMGFGDWAPHPHSFFRFIVTFEALVGIFTMALFVGSFTRKVIR